MMKERCFRLICIIVIILFTDILNVSAQHVVVDEKGVMRWEKTGAEVYGFGVNYSVPFAHAYRSGKKLNIDLEKAIENDIYHFARLGFDAYRVHVWDTEISDTLGNLLNNEHLRLFDFSIHKMKERGIKFIITPIAFWGNGWPEPDEQTPGFSRKYGKAACLTNEDAIKAQENYLAQFLNHVNPYTGLAYKDDPDIVAFEVSNEPHHRQEPDSVTRYIKKMVNAMRSTGCKKPIFYNISHSIHLVDAYYNAGIQGGTFQWYPTGLVFRKELKGNFLPNVDAYKIPFAKNPQFEKGAKIVYEFDAADIGRSYIYPAMARSFRTAGIQWATHFAYDPTFLSYANTEYNTHYMNLVYTPQKALSLKIAGEVFHKVPLYKDYGKFPQNTRFDAFRVSYDEDLAEMVTDTKYFYTNHTSTNPPAPRKLEEVAGYGHSPLVNYEGTGAYFIDRIDKGVWRLEVLPDAIWIEDPFGTNSLNRTVAVINWRAWPMKINLPELAGKFSVQAINEGNNWTSEVTNGEFTIRPGVYLLTKDGVKSKVKPDQKWKNIQLSEYFAPETTLEKQYVFHEPYTALCSGVDYTIRASIIDRNAPQSVEVVVAGSWPLKRYKMEKQGGYEYTVKIPGSEISEGILRYYIVVQGREVAKTYPGDRPTSPGDWDFDGNIAYEVNVLAGETPIFIFNALSDNDEVMRQWAQGSKLVPLAEPGKAELRLHIDRLFRRDPENPNGEEIRDYSMQYYFAHKFQGRKERLQTINELVFRGRSLSENTGTIQVALMCKNGKTYGKTIDIGSDTKEYRIPISDLKEVPQLLLPRPYPTFLSYYFQNESSVALDIYLVESLQISIGPGISSEKLDGKHGLAVESIRLE
jgi:hypothetical protein